MTQISYQEAVCRQSSTGVRLTKLEMIQVKFEVSQSLQAQKGFESVQIKGANMEAEAFHELIEICNSDAAHVATSWQVEADADWLDLKRTEEDARF